MTTEFTLQSSVNFPVALWVETASIAYAGCQSLSAFTIHLSAEDTNPHTVELYAQNSQSAPYQQPQNKWSHLVPQWRFLDVDGNQIDSITPTASTVVLSGDETIGMYASAQFFYVDDKPSLPCSPVIIWAIVDYSQYPVYLDEEENQEPVPGYANSKVGAAIAYPIYSLEADHFELTRNGQDPLFDIYWKDSTIPFMLTVNGTVSSNPGFEDVNCNPILFGVPTTNMLGATGDPITFELVPELSSAVFSPSSVYLSAFDVNNFPVGGVARSTVTTNETITDGILSAAGQVFYEEYVYSIPSLWISNPNNNTLNKMTVPCIDPDLITSIGEYFRPEQYSGVTDSGGSDLSTSYNIDYLQVSAAEVMGLSGFSGIYSMAVDSADNLWASDAENDKLYKFDMTATLLSTVFFEEGSTPAGISVDSADNVWVSLVDAESALKIDGITGATIASVTHGYPAPIADPLYPEADIVFKPTIVETDSNDDIFVSYTNTISSAVHKYSSTGALIAQSDFAGTNPMDIIVTSTDDIWVSQQYSTFPVGIIQKLDGTTLASLDAIFGTTPSYMTMDNQDTLFYVHGWNSVSEYTSGGASRTTTVGTPYDDAYLDEDYSALEGIGYDEYGRLWVIDSIANLLYQIDLTNFLAAPGTYIRPIEKKIFYNDEGYSYYETSPTAKSAQAFGDWTGQRYNIKYGSTASDAIYETTVLQPFLTGVSVPFNIEDYTGYEVRKFNESWDASNEIRSYAIAPHIAGNEVLWGGYMDAVWGNSSTPYADAFGRSTYEKIANFTQNKVDIGTCEIDDIYSLAEETDVSIDDYNFVYPTDLKRLMDIISINQQQLWGARCACNENITNDYELVISGGQLVPVDRNCIRCGHKHPGNRGELFDPLTYEVSATIPFIVQDKYLEQDTSIVYPPLSCTNSVCISAYALEDSYDWLLPNVYDIVDVSTDFDKTAKRFYFFNYTEASCDEQVEGIINWDDEYTTLSENTSSLSAWYGAGGIVEKMINYTLHKGLGIIEE